MTPTIPIAIVWGGALIISLLLHADRIQKSRLRRTLIETEGTIVRLTRGSPYAKAYSLRRPIIQYSVNGRTYLFKGKYYVSQNAIGRKVPLVYDPTRRRRVFTREETRGTALIPLLGLDTTLILCLVLGGLFYFN